MIMKRKICYFASFIFLLAIGSMLMACSSDDDVSDQVKLSDLLKIPSDQDEEITDITSVTWKLYGYGNVMTGLIRKSESLEHNWQNIVTFSKEGTISGYSSSNDLYGEYSISGSNMEIIRWGGSKVGEVLDGEKFFQSFKLCKEFEITNNWLKLYYNEGHDILLFKSLK